MMTPPKSEQTAQAQKKVEPINFKPAKENLENMKKVFEKARKAQALN
ncbi:hypothetical protein [Hahella ganghwensis]|nr:hypothetical protein [Hahella ganghwensis]